MRGNTNPPPHIVLINTRPLQSAGQILPRRIILPLLAAGVFASGAFADPVAYEFSGNVTTSFSSSPDDPDFAVFADALYVTGTLTAQTGSPDDDPSSSYGLFNGVPLVFSVNIPGIGAWDSSNSGLVEVWDNEQGIYPFADAASFVGGETDTFSGTSIGSSVFTGVQLVFGGSDMHSSDGIPSAIDGWEKAFLYLRFTDYSDGYQPTTVHIQFNAPSGFGVSPVPEPSAFALLGLGATALLFARRRAKR